MRDAPMNYQDDEATLSEWFHIPDEQRLAIGKEYGNRKKRPAVGSSSAPVPAKAKPAATVAASRDPAPLAASRRSPSDASRPGRRSSRTHLPRRFLMHAMIRASLSYVSSASAPPAIFMPMATPV
jgi:hypothetical protein